MGKEEGKGQAYPVLVFGEVLFSTTGKVSPGRTKDKIIAGSSFFL
jgi:hypothetical protein